VALPPADAARRALTEYPSASGGMTVSFRRPLPPLFRERERKKCLKMICFVEEQKIHFVHLSSLMLAASN
jgi:hypothetical protein